MKTAILSGTVAALALSLSACGSSNDAAADAMATQSADTNMGMSSDPAAMGSDAAMPSPTMAASDGAMTEPAGSASAMPSDGTGK